WPRRAGGHPLPTLQDGADVAGGDVPDAARVAHEGAQRTADAAQDPVHDRDVAARHHDAGEVVAVLALVVVVALVVAVVDARARRVAPVVDRGRHALLDETALADEDVALAGALGVVVGGVGVAAVAQAHVGEIGGRGVDGELTRPAAPGGDG